MLPANTSVRGQPVLSFEPIRWAGTLDQMSNPER